MEDVLGERAGAVPLEGIVEYAFSMRPPGCAGWVRGMKIEGYDGEILLDAGCGSVPAALSRGKYVSGTVSVRDGPAPGIYAVAFTVFEKRKGTPLGEYPATGRR